MIALGIWYISASEKGKNYLTLMMVLFPWLLESFLVRLISLHSKTKINLICADNLIVVCCFVLLYIDILDMSFPVFISLKIVSHPIKMKLASGMILTHG